MNKLYKIVKQSNLPWNEKKGKNRKEKLQQNKKEKETEERRSHQRKRQIKKEKRKETKRARQSMTSWWLAGQYAGRKKAKYSE